MLLKEPVQQENDIATGDGARDQERQAAATKFVQDAENPQLAATFGAVLDEIVALEVFSGLNVQIALEFIRTFPTPQAAALSWQEFRAFAAKHRYSNRKNLPNCFARLQKEYAEPIAATVQVYKAEAVLLATLLLNSLRTKNDTKRELQNLFHQHADAVVFDSLPGAGPYLGPALLVKFGDDRRRFPTPGSIQALAGTCPVTESSGKRKVIKFRRGCDREFRDIAQQWARCSISELPWAATYLEKVRARGCSENHAYRCLANRWLAIAWKLWQIRQPYDEDYHLQQSVWHGKLTD